MRRGYSLFLVPPTARPVLFFAVGLGMLCRDRVLRHFNQRARPQLGYI